MKRLTLLVVVLGLLLLAGGQQAMAGPVLDFTGGAALPTNEWIAYKFTVTTPITIGGLGVFDVGADGLAGSHELGLWSCGNLACTTGTPLASATITTGNSLPVASTSSAGDWRFTPIASLTLAPADYVVAGQFTGPGFTTGPDQLVSVSSPFISTIAGVTFDEMREGAGPLGFPADGAVSTNHAFFGPNLFVGSLAVAAPEPSALLLLSTGLAGLAGLAWRRGRRK